VNHTCILKEVLLPDWAHRDKQVIKGDRVDSKMLTATHQCTHPRRVEPSSVLLGELQNLHFLLQNQEPWQYNCRIINVCKQETWSSSLLSTRTRGSFLRDRWPLSRWLPFIYLLPKLRMSGVLPLLPHTLAGCTTWFQEQCSFVTYLVSSVIMFPIGGIFTHSFLGPNYFPNL
jgi:hypothetical protein